MKNLERLNMDFVYLSIALLLSMTPCMGQTDETPSEPSFEVTIFPKPPVANVDIGKSKSFLCKISNHDPADTYTLDWSKDGGEPITSTDPQSLLYIKPSADRKTLRVRNAQEDAAGKYRCTVTSSTGETHFVETQLEVYKPLEVDVKPSQFGILGQDGHVICKATAQPPPELTWKRDSEASPDLQNSEKYIISQGKLTIKNLEFDDGGKYICEITIVSTGDVNPHTVDFEVVELPVITGALGIQPNNPEVGKEGKITCKAQGTPAPMYSFKKGQTVLPDTMVDSVQGILTIAELKRSDEGEYTCIATNRGGSVEKSNTLDVLIPPEVEDIPDVPEAVEGSTVDIVCKATGDPEPGMAWRKVGMDVDYTEGPQEGGPTITKTADSPDNAEIKEVELKMTFNSIAAENAGEYECQAFNDLNKVSTKVKVDVQYKPIFQVVNEDIFYGWNGHTANLTCQVKANPAASISWHQKNPEDPTQLDEINSGGIYTVPELNMDGHISASSLLIKIGEDTSVYKDYTCKAVNVQVRQDETISKDVNLKQAYAPNQPRASVKEMLSTVGELFVEKPANNGGQPVTKYTYTYSKDNAMVDEGEADASDDRTVIKLKNLQPSSQYIMTIHAVNVVGEGEAVSLVIKTADVSAPFQLIFSSNIMGEDADSYTVQWKAPNDGGAPITKFLIRYKQIEVKGQGDELSVLKYIDTEYKTQEIVDSKALSGTIEGLERDSYYEVRISAFNSQGQSDEVVKIVKTSKGEGEVEEGGKEGGSSSDGQKNEGKKEGDEKDGEEEEEEEDGGAGASSSDDGKASSAGLGSGIVIGIIIGIIVLIIVVVIIIYLVVKRKPQLLRGGGGDEERGQAQDRKAAAEEEKLIQKEDTAKVENENVDAKKDDGVEAKPGEFEPDTKPETPAEPPADQLADVPATDVKPQAEITVTPPDNSTA